MIAASHILTPDTRSIDWRQPINWADPLNDGLVSWWLAVLHHTAGTATWRDLCGKNDGTLTNFSSVDTAWKTQGQPGGFGALDFAGATDFVAAGNTTIGAADLTICAWVTVAAGNTTGTIYDNFGGGNELGFDLYSGSTSAHLYIDGAGASGATTLANDRWYHLAATRRGSACAVYVDAVVDGTGTNSNSAPGTSPRIGSYNATGGNSWGGQIADVRCWNRALTADEIQDYYYRSQRHYSGLLNRPSRRSVFAPSTGTTITPATLSISAALQGSPPVSSRTIEVT
jgi:hypothetical protein